MNRSRAATIPALQGVMCVCDGSRSRGREDHLLLAPTALGQIVAEARDPMVHLRKLGDTGVGFRGVARKHAQPSESRPRQERVLGDAFFDEARDIEVSCGMRMCRRHAPSCSVSNGR
jgi:hypothetical protein